MNQSEKYNGLKPLGRPFEHRFANGNHTITVKNSGDDADVIINNESFNEAYSRKIWERMYSAKGLDYKAQARQILEENGFGQSQEEENFLDVDSDGIEDRNGLVEFELLDSLI